MSANDTVIVHTREQLGDAAETLLKKFALALDDNHMRMAVIVAGVVQEPDGLKPYCALRHMLPPSMLIREAGVMLGLAIEEFGTKAPPSLRAAMEEIEAALEFMKPRSTKPPLVVVKGRE